MAIRNSSHTTQTKVAMAATNEPAIRMPGLTPCYLTARFTIADAYARPGREKASLVSGGRARTAEAHSARQGQRH